MASNVIGKLFEQAVRYALLRAGFRDVQPDGDYIYKGAPGLMIHGLGQPHNADVLMEPPFQMPFGFPERFLVECKAYAKPVGIDVARSILGLRGDINTFEIVDLSLLKRRRNPSRTSQAHISRDRFYYQVGLASLNDVAVSTQEFLLAHRIPLLLFGKINPFSKLRNLLVEDINWDGFVFSIDSEGDITCSGSDALKEKISNAWAAIKQGLSGSLVAVLDNGIPLLLIHDGTQGESPTFENLSGAVKYRIRRHDGDSSGVWKMEFVSSTNVSMIYEFELPAQYYEDWIKSHDVDAGALEIKNKWFRNMAVIGAEDHRRFCIVLPIDREHLDEIRRRLMGA